MSIESCRGKSKDGKESVWPFRGICLSVPKQKDYEVFKQLIAEVLPTYKCNTLVLLIRYRYQFKSHPQVSDREALSPAQAEEIAGICRENGIRIIPKMNLFGHQSGEKRGSEQGLLRSYPELDETPEKEQVGYCRSLCPRHPLSKKLVFDLADELIDAFKADAIHVGLDEVFEIGECPRCKDTPNHILFSEWVNTLHQHFVKEKGVEMLMWADRLLDGNETGYGSWEASVNDTWKAIDTIPKDIILCDWHYLKRDSYPSMPLFLDKGFRVVACPWKEIEATEAFLEYVSEFDSEGFLGVLATTWSDSGPVARFLLDLESEPDEKSQKVGNSFIRAMTFNA